MPRPDHMQRSHPRNRHRALPTRYVQDDGTANVRTEVSIGLCRPVSPALSAPQDEKSELAVGVSSAGFEFDGGLRPR